MKPTARPQRTIARETEINGFGFFTGKDVRVRFKPARVNTGIVFVRVPKVPAPQAALPAGGANGSGGHHAPAAGATSATPSGPSATPSNGSSAVLPLVGGGSPAAGSTTSPTAAAATSSASSAVATALTSASATAVAEVPLPETDRLLQPAPATVPATAPDNAEGGEPESPVRIPAHISQVTRRLRRTTLREGTVGIETTEHCMAALAGLGIDNLVIEVDADELPGLDGSAVVYVDELRAAGIVDQDVERRTCVITKPLSVRDGDALLAAFPGPPGELTITYCLDLRGTYGPDCPIRPQTFTFRFGEAEFVEQIAPARTWLLEQEVEYMRSQGLGLRVTGRDVLVMGRDGPVGNELRYADELARHKVLDLIGDLYLLNRHLQGVIYARGSGHALNHDLARGLLEMMEEDSRADIGRTEAVLDVRQVQRILPHRYPMLLVDKVLELRDTRGVGIKNVTINEGFFQGHYPTTPVMPGVLIVEALAQLSGVVLLRKLEHTGKVAYLVAMDKVKIRRPVVPGDQLLLEADVLRHKSRTGVVSCRATVAGRPVAEAELTFMLGDAEPV